MSSLRAPSPRTPGRSFVSRLRAVPTTRRATSQVPFILVFVVLLAVGMFGLLMLTTKLQDQAFELSNLKREATELSYREASLEVEVDKARSPQSLAALASALGMRPNEHAVYVQLPSGKIIGKPVAVKDSDGSSIVITSAEESAAQAAARAEADAQSNGG